MKIIDAWAQHPSPGFLQQPWLASLMRWTKQTPRDIPLEMTVAAMDAGDVDLALLSAWYGPDGALISNEDVLACVDAHPDRFAGLASGDIRDPVGCVRDIRRYVGEHGFKGVRFVQWLWERPVTDALYYPGLAACVELDVPVCLQVGLTGPLRPSTTGSPLSIERIALDFPKLKIVCGHIGYPWTQEMIAIATKFENVYIDTSAYKPNRYPPELVTYMKAHGREKVLFGTNYPMITPAACLEKLDLLDLDEATTTAFLSGNAERVFAL